MAESNMRLPITGGITWGNLFSAAVTIAAVAGGVYAFQSVTSYQMTQMDRRVTALEATVSDIRLTYATNGSLHELQADQRTALAPLQVKLDQLVDRIATVDRNQAETGAIVKTLNEAVQDIKRALERRQSTAFKPTIQAQERPP